MHLAVNSATELNSAHSWGRKPTNPEQSVLQQGLPEHLLVPTLLRLQVVMKAVFLSPSCIFGKMLVHVQ